LAAIKAKDAVPELNVTVIEKAHVRRSGALATGMDAMNVVSAPGVSTPQEYVERVNGAWLNGIIDEDLQYVLAEQSHNIVRDLESWGVEFAKIEDRYDLKDNTLCGKILLPLAGDSHSLKVKLSAQVEERGVQVVNHTMATSLVADAGRVVGATALNVRDGAFSVISAKAVVIATGGCARFGLAASGYLYGTFDFPGNAGDGYAMGYRVGAELTGLEYVRYNLVAKDLNAPLAKFVEAFPGEPTVPEEARMRRVDAHGKAVPVRDRVPGPFPTDPSHASPRVIDFHPEYWESLDFYKGHGPWFLTATHLPEHILTLFEATMFRASERRRAVQQYFRERGLSFARDHLELHPSPSTLCGGHGFTGFVIDRNARTSIEGLYAAGDVASVPRQMLTGAFVFGGIAGISAAQHASSTSRPTLDDRTVLHHKNEIYAPLERTDGLTPADVEFKLRSKINAYVNPPKNETKLRIALEWIRRFREDLKHLKATDAHELGRAIEVGFILDCTEMAVRASLARTETRWGIYDYRSDYPNRDDAHWLRHVGVKKDAKTGGMTVFTRPVGKPRGVDGCRYE
jgi:succinate dehydrogenase/fumarate reductase flavoprotein subunit